MNQPNAEGLVPVYMLQAFGRNFPKTIAGFPADLAAALVKKGIAQWDLSGASVAPVQTPVDGESKPAEGAPAGGPVPIPEKWEDLHFLQQIKLAKAIAGTDTPMKAAEAVEIITAEVARRANPEGVN